MTGPKTHEHQKRQIAEGSDSQNVRPDPDSTTHSAATTAGPQDDNPNMVTQATNRESRDHNKNNHQGQSGHKPQKHSPDE